MSDPVDEANDLCELTMQNQLANFRAALRSTSLENCEDYDSEIPASRQAIGGVTRCVYCQEVHEKKQKHFYKRG